MKTTLRKELTREGFDWSTGRIVIHVTDGIWCRTILEVIDLKPGESHPILDQEFDDGYGRYEQPLFAAEDAKAFYAGVQYDGSASIGVILKDLNRYASRQAEVPVFGG